MRAVISGLSLALGLSFSAAPIWADEVWNTPFGPVAWEDDYGETAVLRLDDAESGRVVRLYVEGLAADVMGGRGAYRGVWIASAGDDPCAVQVTGPDGFKSSHWGQFIMTFVNDAFPSDWAGVYGSCLDQPGTAISAVAQYGG